MHQEKKQILLNNDSAASDNDLVASFDDLVDVLPNILGYLTLKDIMCKRRINKKTMEAAKTTIVPPTTFVVNTLDSYNAMRVMTEALPNLQQITLCDLGQGLMFEPPDWGHIWSDGEDPNQERAARTADFTTYDIEMISNFSKLRMLTIQSRKLNGRYPFLFNSFPILQKLTIYCCHYLKWDLEMLAELPELKELFCFGSYCLTGNINSLRVLKQTLEKVIIESCRHVEGNFMDLADFPHLEYLDLEDTAVTGDIRDIGENDFSKLEVLTLPRGVYGGNYNEFQRISDGHALIRAVYLLRKQRPALKLKYWHAKLSRDSPDWYDSADEDRGKTPPFYIRFVKAGSRVGYRWESDHDSPCEVNWLDPEPDKDSCDYEIYSEELQTIENQVGMYRGFHQPPTEEEYRRLIEG